MADLKAEALVLASQGVEIFPVGLDKRPRCKNGFHDATTDRDKIASWDWDEGIGAIIPKGQFVVDIDIRNNGDSTVDALRKAGLYLPGTRTHRTQGGGLHRFYKLPDDIGDVKLRGQLGIGVDIKAHGKGYVLYPPTPGYSLEWNCDVKEAPKWLLDEIVKPDASDTESEGRPPKFFDMFGESGTEYGIKSLEGEIGRLMMIQEGGRNNALNRSSFAMAQLCAGGELPEDSTIARLELAGSRMGLDEKEIHQTVQSGWDAGRQMPREAPKSENKDPSVATTKTQPSGPNSGAWDIPPDHDEDHFWLDWESADDTPPPFYLFPMIPKNAYVLVYGATEASKSMVFMALAIQGSHLNIRSSMYSLENPSHIDIDRVRRLGPDATNFRISNQMLDLNDPVQVHAMIDRETTWPGGLATDLLIIDTYSHAFNTRTEDGNAKAIDFARRIRYIMHKVGCTVILVDHTGYSDHGEPRDASAKRQQVDVAIKMDKVGKWAPGEDSRWSMENLKSARFGNPGFWRGRITDVKPGRGLKLAWDPGYEPEWRQ